MSERAVPTIIIEPHRLLRDGLTSLISNFSYRIIDSFSSVSEVVELPDVGGQNQLVLLGLQRFDAAESAAAHIHRIWPDCKIVLLLDYLSPDDYQNLLTSNIDGYVPLYASRHVLISTLDLVVFNNVRIIVMPETEQHRKTVDASRHAIAADAHCSRIDRAGFSPRQAEAATPYLIAPPQMSGIVPFETIESSTPATAEHGGHETDGHPIIHHHHNNGSGVNGSGTRAPRNCPRLSTREWQILSGLVKGHANKVIARDCNITEATVKVHMKSILRKIRVDNRTQAAVWALENGSSPQEIDDRLSTAVAEFTD